MRNLLHFTRGAVLLAAFLGWSTYGQTTNSTLTGQWDFNQGNLKATVGTDLQYFGTSSNTTTFEEVVVNGAMAKVMHFADDTQGFLMFHGAKSNGGGTNVNLYTLVMDIMWPPESDGTFRALFTTDTNNLSDAAMLVNPDNGVGINNDYTTADNGGVMTAGTWYRLALVYNLTNGTVAKYLNAPTNSAVQNLGENAVDSQFSLGSALLLFTDSAAEIRGALVDRILFYSEALSTEQIQALGTPIGDGGPPQVGDVKIDSIRKVGENMEITVSGGGTLQLQKKAKLSDAAWQSTEQQVSNSGTFTVPVSDPTSFFRVQRL